MPELASRTTAGGAVGDTNAGYVIHKVFADGVYGWRVAASATLIAGTAANMAARPAIADVVEGFEVYVETNKLTFVARGGVYEVADIQVTVADDAERDALTEMVDKQRAYIADQDSIDTYDLATTSWVEGVATIVFDNYDDITSPADYTVGDKLVVTADADESLRGNYEVLGAAVGSPGVYIERA